MVSFQSSSNFDAYIDDNLLFLEKCSRNGVYACDNGGICKVKNNNNISCECPKQFYGEKCEMGKSSQH